MTIQSTWLTHESEVGVGNDRSLEHPPQDHHTPRWIDELQDQWGEKLVVDEFDENNGDDDYRSKNGWKGRDLVHDRNSPVRITSYFVKCR